MVLAEILGPQALILVGLIVLVFGASQLPKLARSLGSAQGEFKKGLEEGNNIAEVGKGPAA